MQRLLLVFGVVAFAAVVGVQEYLYPKSDTPDQAPPSDASDQTSQTTNVSQNPQVTAIYNPLATEAGDRFGSAVAAFGDMIIVGTPKIQSPNRDVLGHAHVLSATTGELLHELINPDQLPSDEFGSTVAINGRYALVGAPRADDFYGAAYLFNVETGELVHKFSNPDNVQYGYFGNLVAMNQDRILIGGTFHGVPFGQAFVFDLEDRDRAMRLVLPTTGVNEDLGAAVAMNERFVALSHIFRRYDGRSFDQYSRVIAYDVCTGERVAVFRNPYNTSGSSLRADLSYGDALALHDDQLLVGGRRKPMTRAGAVDLYDLTTKTRVRQFSSGRNDTPVNFGSGVALNDTHAVISTDYFSVSEQRLETGEVYVFDIQTGEELLRADFRKRKTGSNFDRLVVDITATHFVVGDGSDDLTEERGGAVYIRPLPGLEISSTGLAEPLLTASERANCNAAFLQASSSISDVTAEGLEIAAAAAAAETERQEALEVEAAERAAAEAAEAARPLTDSEKITALSDRGFDLTLALRAVQESDLSDLDKSRLLIDLINADGNRRDLPGVLEQAREMVFR